VSDEPLGEAPRYSDDELMAEACRLAVDAAVHDWGGPFGAVIATADGRIVARGQNRVLVSGDITAHAEIEAIRKAVAVLNPDAPTIPPARRDRSTLELIPRPEGSDDPVPHRARMLSGLRIFASGAPCPMCMAAIYWARLDAVYFANDLEATRAIGFDDAFQYEDFNRPLEERRIPIVQFRSDLGEESYRAWMEKPDRHPY
jgi:guanine deaminase